MAKLKKHFANQFNGSSEGNKDSGRIHTLVTPYIVTQDKQYATKKPKHKKNQNAKTKTNPTKPNKITNPQDHPRLPPPHSINNTLTKTANFIAAVKFKY